MTENWKRALLMERAKNKFMKALTTILEYTEKKEPKTLPEAHHMLVLIGLIARETLREAEMEKNEFETTGVL
jgi:hypothetical protein